MGALVVLVGLIVVGGLAYFMILGAGAFWVVGSVERDARRRAGAVARAPQIFDATFVGESVTVVFGPSTLPFDAWVTGALERGYRLAGQQQTSEGLAGTLVFHRAPA